MGSLRLCAPNVAGPGSNPGRGTKTIPRDTAKNWHAATKAEYPRCHNYHLVLPNKEIKINIKKVKQTGSSQGPGLEGRAGRPISESQL